MKRFQASSRSSSVIGYNSQFAESRDETKYGEGITAILQEVTTVNLRKVEMKLKTKEKEKQKELSYNSQFAESRDETV